MNRLKLIIIFLVVISLGLAIGNMFPNVKDKLQRNLVEATEEYESAKILLDKARTKLLNVKLEISEECLRDPERSFEEKDECKYGSDGLKAVSERLGIEYIPRYDFPGDLFYTYLKEEGVYISQTPAEHYASNGIWATDVATGGRALKMYAPDLSNKEVEYVVSYDTEYLNQYGKALVLTNGMEQFRIGHITSTLQDGVTIKTGDLIGITNMEGASTGYHAHIEYWTGVQRPEGINWSQTEYKVDPNYNPHDRFKRETSGDKTHLAEGSSLYKNYNTPWQILSAIHFVESGRQKVQHKTSSAGAKGTMQFMPLTWNAYCSDLDNGVLQDDITCADRYLQANLSIKKTWIKTIFQYNHSNYYVAKVLREAKRLGLELNESQNNFITNY